jgi:hypothetical protein
MKFILFFLVLLLSACKSTPSTQADIEKNKKSAIELLVRIDKHYSCLDINSMKFGNTSIFSGEQLERVNQYIREYNMTESHYNDLKKGQINVNKYIKHAQRLKGYGKDVYYDYIRETNGAFSVPQVLRGHYCESLLKDISSDAYKKTLDNVINFEDPSYDDISSKALLALGGGISKLIPSSSTVGAKNNLKRINNKLKSKHICQCTAKINPSKSLTHSVVSKLSTRLCESVDSENFVNFLDTEIAVYEEKINLRNLGINSVDKDNIIYQYNEMRKSNVAAHFQESQRENTLVHYISELSPYIASMNKNDIDVTIYSCVKEFQAKSEYDLLY